MLIRIKSSIEKTSWYAETINNIFYVWEIPGSPFYWADYELPIFKSDAEIIKQSSAEKGNQKEKAIN